MKLIGSKIKIYTLSPTCEELVYNENPVKTNKDYTKTINSNLNVSIASFSQL